MRRLLFIFLILCIAAPSHAWFLKKKAAAGQSAPITKIISNNTLGSYIGDYGGEIDTRIWLYNQTTNYGTAANFEITSYAIGDHANALVAFGGLSNIPANATITSVTIGLFFNGGSAGVTITVKRLLRNWVETEATWLVYSGINTWTTPGALSDNNDRSSTVTATYTAASTPSTWDTFTSSQLVTDVQNIVNGTNVNYGWHFEHTSGENDSKYTQYQSGQSATLGPYLSVTYTVPQ